MTNAGDLLNDVAGHPKKSMSTLNGVLVLTRTIRLSRKPLMTKILTALIAAATLATATAAAPTTAQERCIGCGIGGVEYPIAPPGYGYYPAYYERLPGSNCYWFRVPAYDARGNMVGWRGRPEAFCS
jgi:hypothetical protein